MKRLILGLLATAGALGGASAVLAAPADPPVIQQKAPRTDGDGVPETQWEPTKPPSDPRDFSGLWEMPRIGVTLRLADGSLPPFTEAEAASYRQRIDAEKSGNVITDAPTQCFPHGVPRLTTAPYPIRFVQMQGLVVMLHEVSHNVRYIHMDGKPPPADTPLTFLGYSVGRWEGNTLVVETTHQSPETKLDTFISHGPKLKVTERWTKMKNNYGNTILRDEITIDDPDHFTRPWSVIRDFAYRSDVENSLGAAGLVEYSCEENNRNVPTAEGIVTAK